MAKSKKELDDILVGLKAEKSGGSKGIFKLETYIDEDETKPRTLFLKKPDRMTRNIAEKQAAKDTGKGIAVLLRGMNLGGDDVDEIIANGDALYTAGEAIMDIIQIKEGKISKV